jgi:TDG/mug DNA glycosylase family protein
VAAISQNMATLIVRSRGESDVRKFGLAPVIDDNTEVLILGTLPSDVSLANRQYYANSNNDFWKILGEVLDKNLEALSYERRIEALKAHGIGLWDAYYNCVRPGSMDNDITEQEMNDFSGLKNIAPNLRLVCFNGKKAGASEGLLRDLGYLTLVLPSSSGANRRDQKHRLRCWKSVGSNR